MRPADALTGRVSLSLLAHFDSPLGCLAARFAEDGTLESLNFNDETNASSEAPVGSTAHAQAEPLRLALDRYFRGEPEDFRGVVIAPRGTPFQQRVWAALREIPHGATRSYAELAKMVGSNPRTVGQANGQNPIAVVVPCHRVIGSDGSLVGYAGGIERKRRLLVIEGSRLF